MADGSTPTAARPRRRSPGGGYRRGEETRLRVITTAIRVFGERGFEGASTREIALQAGVTPPVLLYYFDSKLGLYQACVDQITAAIWSRIEPAVAEAERLLATEADARALIDCYCRLQDHAIDSFVSPVEGPVFGRLMMWEDAASDTRAARNLLRERVDGPVFRVISGIVARIRSRPVDAAETGLHVFALAGIFLVFHLDRERIFGSMGWRPDEEGHAAQLKAVVREQATTLLENLARAHGTWREAPPIS